MVLLGTFKSPEQIYSESQITESVSLSLYDCLHSNPYKKCFPSNGFSFPYVHIIIRAEMQSVLKINKCKPLFMPLTYVKDFCYRLHSWLLLTFAHTAIQGCPWISQQQKTVFLFLVLFLLLFFFSPPSLPRVSTAEAAAVSVDENVGASSPLHIFHCSSWTKLHVIAGQFHHSHLFCLLLICLFSRVS